MAVRIQMRRDTQANWNLNNPTLAEGEMGFEKDTDRWKIGNGIQNWNALPYANSIFSGSSLITDDSTGDALRITQLGSGNALIVEDSVNPDATPFVITGTGKVGIATTEPNYELDVIGTVRGNQIISSASSGTSPIIVTSQTVVTNLNADLLDGQHGSYYAPISSPQLTGIPVAPTASVDTNTTQIATTEYVVGQGYLKSDTAEDTYLTQNSASTTYLTQNSASTTYATIESIKIVITNNQTESYILQLSDAGKIIEMDSSLENTVTISNDSVTNFPIGSTVHIIQMGLGTTTIVADSGVTIYSINSMLNLNGQYAAASLYKKAENTWVAMGNLV